MTNIDTSIEVWKPLYISHYEISTFGRIRNTKRNNYILGDRTGTNGYRICQLGRNSGGTKTVHRLVAIAFIPNTNNLEQVNHIDGNKLNNHVDNLEWVSRSENAKHSFKLGMSYQVLNKKIFAEKEGNTIAFDSILKASQVLGVSRTIIQGALKGLRGKGDRKGYVFRYQ